MRDQTAVFVPQSCRQLCGDGPPKAINQRWHLTSFDTRIRWHFRAQITRAAVSILSHRFAIVRHPYLARRDMLHAGHRALCLQLRSVIVAPTL